MLHDALIAWLHFLTIFALVSVLAAELILFRKTMSAAIVRRLAVVDRWYGICAGLVIVTGLMRVFTGLKGAGYYAHNHVFWTKMLLFVIVALLSIYPTIAFLRFTKREMPDETLALGDAEYRGLRNFLWAEVGLLTLIPLCAALMARGI